MIIQCRHASSWSLVICCLVFFASLFLIHAEQSSDQHNIISHPVLRWLQQDHPEQFYFNPKLKFQGSSIQVQDSLDKSEILMVIPSSAVLSMDQLEEELVEDIFCSLSTRLWVELQAGNDSRFAPYIRYIIQQHAIEPTIPNFWSTIGKRLLGMVYGKYLTTEFLIDWLDDFENCREFLELGENDYKFFENYDNDYTTIWNSNQDNVRRHVMAITARRQIDQLLFVPLYDELEHHPLAHNVQHRVRRREDGLTVTIVATRSIAPGETLYRPSQACLFECVEPRQPIVLDFVRNFGFVPPYPHLWVIPEVELAFTINADDNGSNPTLTWMDKPYEASQIESLEPMYRNLYDKYIHEVQKSATSVPLHEWKVIEEYSSALITALKTAMEYGKKEFKTPNECRQETETRQGECIAKDRVNADSTKGFNADEYNVEQASDEKVQQTNWDPWSITRTSCPNCTLEELEDSRGCAEYSYSTVHNESTWTHLRASYVAVVGVENSTIQATYRSGIRVPFKIDHSPGRGRGVFAMEDVPKGTLVWSSQHTGIFTSGKQFRRFLSVLPDVFVCDLTNWCYTTEDGLEDEDADGVIGCDLDEGSLINSFEKKEEHTVGCTDDVVDDPKLCLENLYTLRDIRKGEELLTDYEDFSTASWEDFGL